MNHYKNDNQLERKDHKDSHFSAISAKDYARMTFDDDDNIVQQKEPLKKIWTRNSCVGSSLPYLAVDEAVQTTQKAYKDTGS